MVFNNNISKKRLLKNAFHKIFNISALHLLTCVMFLTNKTFIKCPDWLLYCWDSGSSSSSSAEVISVFLLAELGDLLTKLRANCLKASR